MTGAVVALLIFALLAGGAKYAWDDFGKLIQVGAGGTAGGNPTPTRLTESARTGTTSGETP